jgi:hypothetical protein
MPTINEILARHDPPDIIEVQIGGAPPVPTLVRQNGFTAAFLEAENLSAAFGITQESDMNRPRSLARRGLTANSQQSSSWYNDGASDASSSYDDDSDTIEDPVVRQRMAVPSFNWSSGSHHRCRRCDPTDTAVFRNQIASEAIRLRPEYLRMKRFMMQTRGWNETEASMFALGRQKHDRDAARTFRDRSFQETRNQIAWSARQRRTRRNNNPAAVPADTNTTTESDPAHPDVSRAHDDAITRALELVVGAEALAAMEGDNAAFDEEDDAADSEEEDSTVPEEDNAAVPEEDNTAVPEAHNTTVEEDIAALLPEENNADSA